MTTANGVDKTLVKYEKTATKRPGKKPGPSPSLPACPLFAGVRERLHKRRMGKELSRLFTRARDYQQNGLPAGSPQYQLLYRQACNTLNEYAKRWGKPLGLVATNEAPSLCNLDKLANPERNLSGVWKLILIALAVTVVTAAIGTFFAVREGTHAIVRRLFGA